ncbi:hypothetical protein ACFSLT_30540 [Novosphingobium resinovorum]
MANVNSPDSWVNSHALASCASTADKATCYRQFDRFLSNGIEWGAKMTYSKKAYPYIILTLIIIVAVVSSLSFWDNKDRCSKSLSGIEKGLSEFGATFYTPNPEDKSITPLVYIESCKKPINLLIADDSKDLILNVLKIPARPPRRHSIQSRRYGIRC